MLQEYKAKTNIGIGFGFFMTIAGRLILGPHVDGGLALIGVLLVVVGLGLWIYGCVSYARGKGRSGWLGGVLAFLWLFGLIILYFLEDKHKEA